MSFVRRQIFVLFALAMVLAIGIALGSGPLAGDDATGSTSGLEGSNAELADQVAALRAADVFDNGAGAAVSGDLLAGRLDSHQVTLVVFPGVADDVTAAAVGAVERAGGTLTTTVSIAPALIDPGKKTYVGSVADSSSADLDDLGDVPSGESYGLIGALLARAYLAHSDDGLVLDDEATKIDSELQGATLVDLDGRLVRRGSLAIVLAPGYHSGDDTADAHVLIASQLIAGLVRGSDAAVLITSSTASEPAGLIDTVRGAEGLAGAPLSTLNVSEGPMAMIAAVFALRAAAAGKQADFGVDGSSVSLPPGLERSAD